MDLGRDSIQEILLQVLEATGYDFREYRSGTIGRRIAKRMALVQIREVGAYIDLLRSDQAECLRLVSELTIKVSHFFRDPYLFEFMNQALWPLLFEDGRNRHIRIWSIGCARGEETYSIAISVLDYMERKKLPSRDYTITIIGTDIDREALQSAESARYNEQAVGEVRKRLLDKYFIFEKGRYSPTPIVKDMVTFSAHDLSSPHTISPPSGVFTNYDLIFCRNVLIYFVPALQEKVLRKILLGLNNQGFIVLGESEALPPHAVGHLCLFDKHGNVYRKLGI